MEINNNLDNPGMRRISFLALVPLNSLKRDAMMSAMVALRLCS